MKSRLVKTVAAVALALTLIVMCMPMALAAQTSGKCGDNATWSYNAQTCELKIEGTGAVEWADEWSQFDESLETPATAKLKTLVIADGITDISDLSWQGYYSLEKVTVPATVTAKIGPVFINQTGVSEIVFNGTKAQWNSIVPNYFMGYEGDVADAELKISCTDGTIVVIENTTVSPSTTKVDNEADTEKKDTNTDSANSNSSVNNNNSADNEASGNSSTIIIVAIAAVVFALIIAIVAVVLVKKK